MKRKSKVQKVKRGQWFEFEMVRETGIYPIDYHCETFEVRLFTRSIREGLHYLKMIYPDFWCAYETRIKHKHVN